MRYRIFTKNNYIKIAFIHLLREIFPKAHACIVDIESYTSFSELLDEIDGIELKDNQYIYILKGNNVHSKVLGPLATFGRDDRLDDIKQLMKIGEPIDWSDLKEYLIMMSELSVLSSKDKEIAWAVAQHTDVSCVAKLANVNHKTIYTRIAIIARKLNLSRLNEVRKFVAGEINYT
ncbi:hypothetical protein M7963_08050 [Enterobacter roggenkampii]|uniref:hypothetical protein n=1 Tax=Enterobacter roggenkampii TaxID=1812935 RepID=UPI002237FB6D|nr:hypothetical protein [Enterobacter roggenkampii]MCW5001469.1 hypothetical protein [Enterobacter roggenkampii]